MTHRTPSYRLHKPTKQAVVTINGQRITLAAKAGHGLSLDPKTASMSRDNPEIDLPPGKFKVTLKVPGSPAQQGEFEVAAGESWGLLVGPDGVPLPVHLY